LQSKTGQPLERYFPELEKVLADLGEEKFVLDEIVVFDDEQFSLTVCYCE
jgi:ATP-dependent DNA ligase